MDRGALDHTLKGCGWYGFGPVDIGDERGKVVINKLCQRRAQRVQIDAAGLHDLGRLGFVDQGQQQMFQGRQFVPTRIGQRQRRMNGLLEGVRK